MAIDVKATDGAITFLVKVVPRASRTEVAGEIDGALRVRVASPPVDGAANAELIKFLAKRLELPRSSIAIVAGETSKNKRIRIEGLTEAELLARLQ
ncbi:MAG: DUF167 domain-containing protein [Blastocatellia bacterium]|nr:DUF167 domain-containing protein [Blastocatellia bacterium]